VWLSLFSIYLFFFAASSSFSTYLFCL